MKTRKKIWTTLALVFAASGISGAKQPEQHGYAIRSGHYRLINPLLDCESYAEKDYGELNSFMHEVEALIQKRKKESSLTDAAVYFRDLNNGPWFGIKIDDQFSPVSLLKVPLMIAWLKHAESQPELLERRIEYKAPKEGVPPQTIDPAVKIIPGQTYTADELIRRMIVYSDNQAANLLFRNMDQDWFLQTHKELGLTVPYTDKPVDYITVKEYSSFFRILFNASYLSREMSEKALEVLSQSDFREGLVAGVPAEVQIAHKFGERQDGDIIQFHDCGIIYFPRRPYILNVMTRGRSPKDLKDTIAAISRLVYNQVEKEFSSKK
jgi:beta-lactamase class A